MKKLPFTKTFCLMLNGPIDRFFRVKNSIQTYFTKERKINFLDDAASFSKISITINDPFGFQKKHSITDKNIINLGGGLPTNNFLAAQIDANAISDDILKIEYRIALELDPSGKPILAAIDRTVDFEYKIIHNDAMVVQKSGGGIGRNLILNQINEARTLGFNIMVVLAAGPGTPPPPFPPFRWDGYKVWAKFGYILDREFHTKYGIWSKRRKLKERSLNALHFNLKKFPLWKADGFFWKGTFNLQKKSKSMLFLKIYLNSKKINVRLNRAGMRR